MSYRVLLCAPILIASAASADWKVLPPHDARQTRPPASLPGDAKPIKPGEKWPNPEKFRWIVSDLEVPQRIENRDSSGHAVGMRINGGDGGEIWVNNKLECRFDNDPP